MKRLTEVLSIRVTFALPDWFANERHEYMVITRYPEDHAWAGQEQSRKYENRQINNLMDLDGVIEVCHCPESQWCVVEFNCSRQYLPGQITRFEEKLNRFLSRYREARV